MNFLLIGKDPELLTVSAPITLPPSQEDEILCKDLLDKVKQFNGRGLAAIQMGVAKQVFVFEKPSGSKRFEVVINPQILSLSSSTRERQEGCFSLPGIIALIKRPSTARVQYVNLKGETIMEELTGNNCSTFLHEYCHLIGRTMLDNNQYGKFVAFVST